MIKNTSKPQNAFKKFQKEAFYGKGLWEDDVGRSTAESLSSYVLEFIFR